MRFSINDSFYDDFNAWDGKNPSVSFTIGNTSEVLQSIGVKNQSVIMRSGMIINKLNKHAEMNRSIFRQIPELLEKPIVVQFSDAIDPKTGKQKYDSRITVLGELYTIVENKNTPVLVALELLPTNQAQTKMLNISIITSAYAKKQLQQYIDQNSILYIDPNKNRTNKWLSLNGLQLPVGETKRGSIRKITYSGGKVKIQNPIHRTQMQEKLYKAGVIDEYGVYIDPNARKSKDDTIYLSVVERGDMETAQRMVDEAANDFAGWGLTRDMQVRYNDTAVIRLPFTNERI